jgi:lantibiotic biosynthesis protein
MTRHQQPAPAAEPRTGAQSLGSGSAGTALLHTELAADGVTSWDSAHAWFAAITSGGVIVGRGASLYHGAPAVAFALHGAQGPGGRYRQALAALDTAVATITQRRLTRAHARIDHGERPLLAEFDLIGGLTGLGAHLLRRHPGSDLMRQVLAYLVRLTEPLPGDSLPGWWTSQAPTGNRPFHLPGGHGNFGMAHGIAGPLALLSLATKRGITLPGQAGAIDRICGWLDTWRQPSPAGAWWPETITFSEATSGQAAQAKPGRPSWCYGTAGLARAQQLAGQATGDHQRQRMAERALADCLADTAQLSLITASGLCHGWAGLYLTAWRVAADTDPPKLLATHLPRLAAALQHATGGMPTGFLEGQAGVALTLRIASTGTPPATDWDACLLLH